MATNQYSANPENEAEQLAACIAKTCEKLGVDVFVICVKQKTGTPNCAAVFSANDPEEARKLLLEVAMRGAQPLARMIVESWENYRFHN